MPEFLSATTEATVLSTLMVASGNLLNLARPGHVFYPNQPPYSDAEYQRKVDWLGEQLSRVNADVLGCQEV